MRSKPRHSNGIVGTQKLNNLYTGVASPLERFLIARGYALRPSPLYSMCIYVYIYIYICILYKHTHTQTLCLSHTHTHTHTHIHIHVDSFDAFGNPTSESDIAFHFCFRKNLRQSIHSACSYHCVPTAVYRLLNRVPINMTHSLKRPRGLAPLAGLNPGAKIVVN